MTREHHPLRQTRVGWTAQETVASGCESGLEYSGLDSERFGLRVFRARNSTLNHALALAIAENECDVAIVRTTAEGASSSELSVPGFEVRHADTLVYYDCDPKRVGLKPARNPHLDIRRADRRDESALVTLVERAFADYPSHYATNERFRSELILAGYVEWATNFIDSPGRAVLVAREAGRTVGFLTYETREDTIEIVLNGVDPDWQGRGVYGDLLRVLLERARNAGVRRIEVSTQVDNYAVQRAWQREGFRLWTAFQTFHINSMLHAGDEVAVLQLQLADGSSNADVQCVLEALQAQAPHLVGDLSRIEITRLVEHIVQGEHSVGIRMHIGRAGARRYAGVIRDSLGRAVGVFCAESTNSERKQAE